MRDPEKGQSLLEFLLSLVLAITTLGGASLIVQKMWNKTRCLHDVFETTHTFRSTALQSPASTLRVQLDHSPHQVTGRAQYRCSGETVRLFKLGENGALHVPLLMALVTLTLAIIGSWSILRHWRHLVELQTRLDRCVGKEALRIARTMSSIERSNLRIQELRAAIQISPLPAVQAPLKAALEATATMQDIQQLRWRASELLWLSRSGCGELGARSLPLPSFMWRRPLRDPIGAKPLQWTKPNRSFAVQSRKASRNSAAIIQQKKDIPNAWPTEWKATWTSWANSY